VHGGAQMFSCIFSSHCCKLFDARTVAGGRPGNKVINKAMCLSLLLAPAFRPCHFIAMPHRPPRKKKPDQKPGELDHRQSRFEQLSDKRRRDMATRSTLSRLRNRKSDLK
jgi:hypothetical protein